MRFRLSALILALALATAPALGAVCQLDCDRPPAASTHCTASHATPDGGVRAAGACDHNHGGVTPALVTGSTARNDQSAPAVAAGMPARALDTADRIGAGAPAPNPRGIPRPPTVPVVLRI